jgi:hypothetical protein
VSELKASTKYTDIPCLRRKRLEARDPTEKVAEDMQPFQIPADEIGSRLQPSWETIATEL